MVPRGKGLCRLCHTLPETVTRGKTRDRHCSIYRRGLPKTGIDSLAFISPKATIGKDVYIGAFAYIGDGVIIGDGTQVYPHAVIGDGVQVGEKCLLYVAMTRAKKSVSISYVGVRSGMLEPFS